jgi:hypothetical protein
MTWLGFFAIVWAVILAAVIIFVVVDARNAYDRDETTATLSGYIKIWRRRHARRSYLLGAACAGLVLVPVWLFFHLVLEAV